MAGCEVEAFHSIEAVVARGLPDGTASLVMDLDLPGLADRRLRRQLAQRIGCRTIFMSTQDVEDRKDLAAEFGPVAVLSKPFTMEALLDAINFSPLGQP